MKNRMGKYRCIFVHMFECIKEKSPLIQVMDIFILLELACMQKRSFNTNQYH